MGPKPGTFSTSCGLLRFFCPCFAAGLRPSYSRIEASLFEAESASPPVYIYIYINSKRYPGCLAKTTRITLQNPVKRLGVSGGTAPFFKLKLRRAWVLQKWFVVDPEWPEFHILFFFVFARDLTLSSFSTFCHLVPLLIAKPCGLCSSLRLDASEKPKDYYIG